MPTTWSRSSSATTSRRLDAKHMVMLTAPDALAGLLLELAAT